MNANDLHELLQKIGIQISRDSNNNFMACCPFHDERSPSWGISQSEPHYHGCFACHAKGTLHDLLIRVGNYSDKEARRICKLGEADPIFDDFDKLEISPHIISKEMLYPYALTKTAMRYLKKRGISRQTAKKLGLLFHHRDKRVLFPWYVGKDLVNVTGRAVNPCDEEVKMLPYFGGKKNKHFYLPSRRIGRGKFYLVEGEIDASLVYEAQVYNVGAIGHGRISKGQKQTLLKSPAEEIVCFFDHDPTGEKLTEDVYEFFSGKKNVSVVDYTQIPGYEKLKQFKLDPASFKPFAIQQILDTCVTRNANWPTI